MNLKNYKNIIFDFDGVIVDSNTIKGDAIRIAVEAFVEDVVLKNKFIDYFIQNNGLPRKDKIEKYFKKLDLDQKILSKYNDILKNKFDNVSFTNGFLSFLNLIKFYSIDLYILSGGEEKEIISILKKKSILQEFKGIKTAPNIKEKNIDEFSINLSQTLYIGDSLIDYKVAKKYNIDFIFMYGYTQFFNWKEYFKTDRDIVCIKDFSTLLNCRC